MPPLIIQRRIPISLPDSLTIDMFAQINFSETSAQQETQEHLVGSSPPGSSVLRPSREV